MSDSIHPDLTGPAAPPEPVGQVIRMDHPEDGERQGEGWAAAKGILAVIAVIAVISFVIQ